MMGHTIKNHPISVTIATAAFVIVFVASLSYRVGQDRTGLEGRILATNDFLVSHTESDEKKWDAQNKINNKVLDRLDAQGRDTSVIKNDLKWLKEQAGG